MKNMYFKIIMYLLFLGTSSIQINAQNFTNYYPSDGLIEGGIYSIVQAQNDAFWFGSWTHPEGTSGLGRFDGTNWQQFTTADGLAGDFVRVIFQDSSGTYWFGTTTGVTRFDGATIINYTTAEGLVNDYVYTIIQDTDGNMWFGTNGGVSKFDGTTWTNYNSEDNAALYSVNSIIQDNNGEFWFGSVGGGVAKFDGVSAWANYTSENSGLVANDIFVLFQDSDNNYWFGTYFGAGVSKFDGTNWTAYTTADGLSSNKVRVITQDSFGDLWFGTNAGLTKFNGTNWTTYTTADGLIPGGVRAITQDNNDDLWIGTWSSGVSKFEISKVNIPDPNFELTLIDIGVDSDGILNGQILRTDALSVTELILTNPKFDPSSGFANTDITNPDIEKIADLTGIEAFENLIKLGLGYGELTNIDLSNNILLDDLFLNDNLLTSIDISKNTLLTRFGVIRNPNIGVVDVSKNTLLKELFLENTGISTINLTNNLDLWKIRLENNNLTDLNISTNINLTELRCQNNNLSGVDASFNTKLTDFNVRYNASMTYLDMRNGNNKNITNIDLRDTSISCINADGIAVPDVSPIMFQYYETILSTDCGTVYIPDPNFEQALIDLGYDSDITVNALLLRSDAEIVTSLNVGGKNISDLSGIEAFTNLIELYPYDNQLTALNVSNNVLLENLFLNDNQVLSLDLSNNTLLKLLNIDRNSMENIILGNHPDLSIILGSGNALNSIDVTNCSALITLSLGGSQITNLDLTNNTSLEEIIVHWNLLTELDISSNPNVSFLLCEGNQLTSLNIANGNNINFSKPPVDWTDYSFNALYNNNLECIQVDADILYNLPTDWVKDDIAVYDDDCTSYTFWGITGSATPNGWNGPDIEFNNTDIGNVFEAIVDLTDGLIKFRQNNNWAVNYGDFGTDGTLDAPPNASDIPVSAGTYKIVMDLNNLTYSITPYRRILGVVGNATPGGWNGPDIPLSFNEISNIWSGNVNLNDGEIKFRLENNWDVNFGDGDWADPNPIYDGILDQNGANIPVTAGYYFVKVDLNAMTYSLVDPYVDIPDSNFEKALIDLGVDTDGVVNSSILRSDAELATEINLNVEAFVSGYGIGTGNPLIINVTEKIIDLTGIEAFVNLTNLSCGYHSLSSINLASNIALTRLELPTNQFTTIDISSLIDLDWFDIIENQIEVIDVSNNVKLRILWLENNLFSTVDVSNNINLLNLAVGVNPMSSLDVSNNSALRVLTAEATQIPTVNLSENINLRQLWLADNSNLISINLYNNPLLFNLGIYNTSISSLDLSNNNITRLYANDNLLLEHLDMRNGNNLNITRFNIGNTSNLTCINADATISQAMIDSGKTFSEDCGDFVYIPDANFEQALIDLGIDSDGVVNTSILRSDAEVVIDLNLTNPLFQSDGFENPLILNVTGKIADLTGIEAFVNLTKLGLGNGALTTVDISNNILLDDLFLNDNLLTSIDITKNTLLTRFGVMRNPITGTIDVSQNVLMEELFLNETGIDNINLLGNANLWKLYIQSNNLTTLDISSNLNIKEIRCQNNQLTQLDITLHSVIERVDAQYNSGFNLITEPTIGNPSLRSLNLSGTGISTFNGATYPNLQWLLLNNNNLTRFNGNNALLVENLFLNNNSIDKLVLSSNTFLKQLHANNNVLTQMDVRNGNNIDLTTLNATDNLLTCISVDNPDDITMPYGAWSVDLGVIFSLNCNAEPEIVLIPDPNFEQALINEGVDLDGIGLNGSILLSDALNTTALNVSVAGIIDMTGIEAFINLTDLNVSGNLLNTINLIENTNLISLDVSGNNLSELFVNSGRNLAILNCSDNQISTLNLSDFTDLEVFNGSINLFESIDATSLDLLTSFDVSSNVLTELDMRNGNNTAISLFDARNNLLGCIGVDDETNIPANWFKDLSTNYTNTGDCTAPIVLTQNISVALDRNGTASISASDIDNGTADNVSLQKDLTFSLDITDFSCADLGINTVILTVTDEAGNFNFATADVLVEDLIAPDAAALRTFTGDLNGMVAFNLFPEDIDSGSSDNCGISGLTIDQSIFTFPGTYTVILTATDTSGNTSTNVTTVEIIDSVTGSETLKFGKLELTIYPVPFSNVINITFSQATDLNTVSVQLVTMLGVDTGVQFFPDGNGNLISSDTSSLSGSFVLQVAVGSSKTKTATIIGNN